MAQVRIRATYMRGGTSKGLFFLASDLPSDPAVRDALLLRALGSPDPYGTQMDGLGGATSSTSKVVLISPSARPDSDVDYLFGAVSIDKPIVDWSGNCGNLSGAVGPFAIAAGLVPLAPDAARTGYTTVRIWQANIGARILARVPIRDGEVLEEGEFRLDGLAFPGAEVRLEFLDPAGTGGEGEEGGSGRLFPTGRPLDRLAVPGIGELELSLLVAGIPCVLVEAAALGLRGIELPGELNLDASLLARLEAIRARATVAMGLASSPEEASSKRLHSPKLVLLSPPQTSPTSEGGQVEGADLDLVARALSMGKAHHALPGTVAIALAAAAALPGTLAHRLARPLGSRVNGELLTLGHPSGRMAVGAEVERREEGWVVTKALMSRSARRLMEGFVLVPGGK